MYLLQNIPVISGLCQVGISTFPLSQQFNYCIAFPIYGHFFIHVFSPLFYISLIPDFYILVQYYNRNIVFTKVKRVTLTKFLVMTITKNSASFSLPAEFFRHITVVPRTGSVHPHFLPSWPSRYRIARSCVWHRSAGHSCTRTVLKSSRGVHPVQ